MAKNRTKSQLDSLLKNNPVAGVKMVEQLDKESKTRSLTHGEENFLCQYLFLGRNEQNKRYDIMNDTRCSRFLFNTFFLIHHRHLAIGGAKHGPANLTFDSKDRKEQLAFLNKWYNTYLEKTKSDPRDESLESRLIREMRKQIKDAKKFARENIVGDHRTAFFIKQIILKGIYVRHLIEENQEEIGIATVQTSLDGNSIEIDSYCAVHTLLRHFAPKMTEYLPKQSYFVDQVIDHKKFYQSIEQLIEHAKAASVSITRSNSVVYYEIEGKLFALHMRPFSKQLKGGQTHDYYRVQSFYPVVGLKEIARTKQLTHVQISDEVTVLK